ncbi:Anaerobic sulfatase-maturating enzyme [Pandoraea terrae]|uniref:Anaerobic sulfatase-maturating enzyme n=1 Tax=Pandoraea terrae TaxID=1537710 RepID=A0A5E4W5B0_9BURK|nr:dynobactin maturation radical SAM/SPASM protein DynA [Pandoraea terrae]VVE19333.1 Anaerobic sulfatase-maturating enzyme [Pandoraea terrae]
MRLVNVVKPTHICNLACEYCYNDDVRKPIMSDATLRNVIAKTIDYANATPVVKDIDFIWHGGEPTVAGIDFFARAIQYQSECDPRATVTNHLQTNGTLLNKKWIRFLKRHDFKISLSLDGPQEINDTYRVTRAGIGTFDKVMSSIELLKLGGFPVGICLVLSKANIHRVEEIYDFLVSHELGFNVIPMTMSGAARDRYQDLGINADEYADAWIRMYDRWFESRAAYTYCQDFVLKTRAILYGKPADCISMANCANFNLSVDPVGDVYSCASLSGNLAARLGNIDENSIGGILDGQRGREFRARDVDAQCAKCKWQHVCHGGCLSRAYKFHGSVHTRDFYCPGLFRIYEHIECRLAERGIHAGHPHPWHLSDGLDPSVLPVTRKISSALRVIPIQSI